MSAIRMLRLVMLCSLVVLFWPRQRVVLGQFPDECQNFETFLECCDQSCTNPNKCIDAVENSFGDGNQSFLLETVGCTPQNPGNPPGVCNSFQDYVPMEDGACGGGTGSFCFSDDDCHLNLTCQNGLCEPPVLDPPEN